MFEQKDISLRCPYCGYVQDVNPKIHLADIRCKNCGKKLAPAGASPITFSRPHGADRFGVMSSGEY